MRIIKRIVSLISITALLLLPLSSYAVEDPLSGTTGSCVWSFDSETGTLTISGEGDMADYQDPSDTPWYYLKSFITKVVASDGVRTIGERAFFSFDSIKNVELGDDVEIIKLFAFGYCTSFEEVKFGDSLEIIGVEAFVECHTLDDVNLPDSLITLDSFAFQGCSGMKKLSLGNSLITIGSHAFSYCSNLTSISLPDSVKTVDWGAFEGCRNLKDIELNDGLEFIGREAFSSNWKLTEITIPDSVRYIGYFEDGAAHTSENLIPGSPFQSDLKLSNIIVSENNPYWSFSDGVFYSKDKKTLISYLRTNSTSDFTVPDGVNCIAEYAFMSSTFESLTLPASVVEIIGNPFEQCKNLTDIYFLGTSYDWDHIYESHDITWSGLKNSGISIHYMSKVSGPVSGTTGDCVWSFDSETGTLTISGEGKMADYADPTNTPWYHLKDYVTKVIADEGVETIGERAFYEFNGIESVVFSDTVEFIDSYAFCRCGKLEDVKFGNGLKNTYWSSFSFCSSLTKITFPDSILQVDGRAFANCTSLTEVNFGKGLSSINYGAFAYCSSLSSISIPANVHEINNEAFYECKSLENVELNEGLIILGTDVFHGCEALKSITIPDSVCFMGSAIFDWQLVLNYSKSIWGSPFSCCEALTEINISSDNNYLSYSNGVLFNKDKTVLITYLTTQFDSSYTIPDTVNSISSSAFAFSNLESITIPKSVTVIDESAFRNCVRIKDIYYEGNVDEWENIRTNYNNSVKNMFKNVTVHYNASYTPDPTSEPQTSETTLATEQTDSTESTVTINTEPTDPTESTAPTVNEPTGPIGPSTPIIDPVTTASTEPKSTEPKATTPSAPKKTQKITAKSSYNLVYGAKSFKIKAKAKGKLSFSAPKNKVIKLSSKGKVKVIGCGIVKVTIKAAKTKVYKKATKKIKITVRPQKPEFKTGKGTVAKYVISFTKVKKISGYEFQYRAKNAKKWKKIYLKKNASRIVLKNLTSIHYRIKLRAYKLVGKKKLYGAFDKASF